MNDKPTGIFTKTTIWLIILFTLVVSAGIYLFIRYQIKKTRLEKYDEISAIADLKLDEITNWYKERIADADYFVHSNELINALKMSRQLGNTDLVRNTFDQIFMRMKQNHRYKEIMLTDSVGNIVYSIDPKHMQLDSSTDIAVKKALRENQVVLNDFFFSRLHHQISLNIVAPIILDQVPANTLVFTIDPVTFLYPLIQNWPSPSKTSETLLVRKEGDSVVFLNELRANPNAALKLKFSLNHKELPAVQAVLGYRGIFDGIDYNGRRVIANLQKVEGTPWFMVAKTNRNEVFNDLTFRIILISFLIAILTLFGVSLLAYGHNRLQKMAFKELYQLEQVLRRSLEDNNRLLEETSSLAHVGSWDFDPVSLTGKCSAEAIRILGMNPGEEPEPVCGLDIFEPDSGELLKKALEECSVTGKGSDLVLSLVTAQKSRKWVHTIVTPVYNGNDPVLVRVILHDITPIKNAEEAIREMNQVLEKRVDERTRQLQEAYQELESFAYTVSHDLRAPLRAIDGFSAILKQDYPDTLDEEGKRIIQVIRKNAQKMGMLIDDLLSFSRVGRASLRHTQVKMSQMVHSVFEEITTEEARKRIRFTQGELHTVKGDPEMLRLVWMNLLTNALKFTSKRDQPVIQVSSYKEDERFVFQVQDNGAGFDMKYYNKLFGVFQRLHSEKEFEGTGVGLAIVHQIIRRHGGQVWAEGKVNEGAVFYFSLPV